ncbi:transcriptional regulator [Rhodococcus sp. NPDC057529]|uniref:transcriptional regulator n=1 Tax=Rhodococcus sp. NPDC057529 TaxID=3346158 RepID=UPI00366C7B0B
MDTRGLLTTQQVLDLVEEHTGRTIAPGTFRAYVARGQAPAAAERIGREPLWRRRDITTWLSKRPGTAGRPSSRPDQSTRDAE